MQPPPSTIRRQNASCDVIGMNAWAHALILRTALGTDTIDACLQVSGIKQVPQVTGTVYIKYNALSKVCLCNAHTAAKVLPTFDNT